MVKSIIVGLIVSAFSLSAFADGSVSASSNVKFNGLFQAWGVNDTQANPWFNMKARRAELKFSGSVAEHTRWGVMVDPVKSPALSSTGGLSNSNDNKIIQDLIWGWQAFDNFEFVVGQFKVPNSAEALDPTGELMFIERAMPIRAWADYREPGFMMTYKWENAKFYFAATNGQGNNVNDVSNSKDITGRAEYNFNDNFKVGAFVLAGDWHRYGTKGRYGANARYKMNEWDFQGEAINDQNAGSPRRGFVAEAGYMMDKWQPCARFDGFDGNGTNSRQYTLGMNYFLSKNNSKISANFSKLVDTAGNGGTPVSSAGNHGNLFVVSFQTSI